MDTRYKLCFKRCKTLEVYKKDYYSISAFYAKKR